MNASLEKKSNRNPGQAYQFLIGSIRNAGSDFSDPAYSDPPSTAYLIAVSDANGSASDLETKRGVMIQAEKSFKSGETTEQQYLLAKSAFEEAQATAERDRKRVESIPNRRLADIFKNSGTSEGLRKAWETRRTDPSLRDTRTKFMDAKERKMDVIRSDRQKFHGTAKSQWHRDRGLTVPTVPEDHRKNIEQEYQKAAQDYHQAVQKHVAENNGYAPGTREHVTDKEEADARKFLPELKEKPPVSVIEKGIWPEEIHRVTLPEDHPSAGKQVIFQKKVRGRTYYDPFAKQTAGMGEYYWDKGMAPNFLY